MILIPSAFFEVLFEPITDSLKRLGNSINTFLKFTLYAFLYMLGIVLIIFLAIATFVIGSGIMVHFFGGQ